MERRTIGMPSGRVSPPAAVTLVGLAVVVGVLAGCQSEETPPATTSSSASVTSASPGASASSPSPSASASVDIPAAARVKSDKGAEAFVRYFFDQVNTAWTTPSAQLISVNSDPGCKSCASLAGTATKLQNERHRYESSPITVKSVSAVAGAPNGQSYVEAELLQNRSNVVDASGKVISTDRESPFERTVAVVWRGDRWLIYDVA